MTAQEKILAKALATTGLSSAEIDLVRAGFKDRAFISARIESIRTLQTMQQNVADWLGSVKREDGALTTRASAISAIMASAKREGIATGTGTVADPGSVARAKVVVDTNADLARGYVSHVQQSSTGARLAFPAQELIRVEERQAKRAWTSKWTSNGGKLYGIRMIALKEDPVWTKISRFGVPYPPFDYGSGMGVEEVDYDTCIELGVITESYKPEGDIVQDFNATLEADMEFKGREDPVYIQMKDWFGDQILFDKAANKVKWQAQMITDNLNAYLEDSTNRQSVILGKASRKASDFAPSVDGQTLSIGADRLGKIYEKHVKGKPDKRSLRLEARELNLIPIVWRNPDDVSIAQTGALLLDMDSSSGDTYRLVVTKDKTGGLIPETFYKMKRMG